jgi:hypothetical protein
MRYTNEIRDIQRPRDGGKTLGISNFQQTAKTGAVGVAC